MIEKLVRYNVDMEETSAKKPTQALTDILNALEVCKKDMKAFLSCSKGEQLMKMTGGDYDHSYDSECKMEKDNQELSLFEKLESKLMQSIDKIVINNSTSTTTSSTE